MNKNCDNSHLRMLVYLLVQATSLAGIHELNHCFATCIRFPPRAPPAKAYRMSALEAQADIDARARNVFLTQKTFDRLGGSRPTKMDFTIYGHVVRSLSA
jgi:hypothetical protein